MKNILIKIFTIICLSMIYFSSSSFIYAADSNLSESEIVIKEGKRNGMLDWLFTPGDDRVVGTVGAQGIQSSILKVAQDFKNLVVILATIGMLVLVFRLFFASNTDEEVTKFKAGILYTALGIAIMQISYSAVAVLFDKDVDKDLGEALIQEIFEPIINLLLFGASFAFLAMGIAAFYMLVTSNGDEEKSKKGKQTVLYAIAGFVVVKFADILVKGSYSGTYNPAGAETTDLIDLLSRIINWVNSFIAIVTLLMIIYAGVQVVFGFGDEEKLKKAKKSLIYIGIGLLILAANYAIVTFFIKPDII